MVDALLRDDRGSDVGTEGGWTYVLECLMQFLAFGEMMWGR